MRVEKWGLVRENDMRVRKRVAEKIMICLRESVNFARKDTRKT